MNIFEIADITNAKLIITRCNNQNNRFMAEFENGEIKDGHIFCCVYGNGKTPEKPNTTAFSIIT
jgi:hypothetical protein